MYRVIEILVCIAVAGTATASSSGSKLSAYLSPDGLYLPLQGTSEPTELENEDKILLTAFKQRCSEDISRRKRITLGDQIEAGTAKSLWRIVQSLLSAREIARKDYTSRLFVDVMDELQARVGLQPAGFQDYLAFVKSRVPDDVRVDSIEMFLEAPNDFLSADRVSVFLHGAREGSSTTIGHLTAFVLVPGQYLDILDSVHMDNLAYPHTVVTTIKGIVDNFSAENPEQKTVVIEHNIGRQTSGSTCYYHAMLSAIQGAVSPTRYPNIAESCSSCILPFAGAQMFATGSVARLAFLDYLARSIGCSNRPIAEDTEEIEDSRLSPQTVERGFFEDRYLELVPQLRDDEEFARTCFLIGDKTPLECARPYFRDLPSSPFPKTTVIQALQAEFDLWHVEQTMAENEMAAAAISD